jgi:hypothetical protein
VLLPSASRKLARKQKGEKVVIFAQAHSSILQTRMEARGKMVEKQRAMNILFGII